MPRVTIKELQEANETLFEKIGDLEKSIMKCATKERKMREQFSRVLAGHGRPEIPRNATPYGRSEPDPFSWEEIFFKIGELNSDANYTILLEQKRNIEMILRRAEEDIAQMKEGHRA